MFLQRLSRRGSVLVLAGLLCVILSSGASAVPLPLPGFGPDTGAQLFMPSGVVVSVEFFDVFSANAAGLEFGFYFASDPTTLVTIFGSEDQDVFPGESAIIDFTNGFVFDLDDAVAQSTFTPAAGAIGFYIKPFPGDPILGDFTLYTQSGLNPLGADTAGVYPDLGGSGGFAIGFDVPETGAVFSFHFVNGVTPEAVPEPATMILVGAGLAGAGLVRRRR